MMRAREAFRKIPAGAFVYFDHSNILVPPFYGTKEEVMEKSADYMDDQVSLTFYEGSGDYVLEGFIEFDLKKFHESMNKPIIDENL